MKRPVATVLVNGALLLLASASLGPLLWMLSVSFMPAGQMDMRDRFMPVVFAPDQPGRLGSVGQELCQRGGRQDA